MNCFFFILHLNKSIQVRKIIKCKNYFSVFIKNKWIIKTIKVVQSIAMSDSLFSFIVRLTVMRQMAYIKTYCTGWIWYNVTHPMFSPNICPKVYLRHKRLCLRKCLNTAVVSMCVYLSGLRAVGVFIMCTLRMSVSGSVQEVSREKGTPLRKCTSKDNFRCLITIWSIGIARRGLNELIFVKTSKFDQNRIFCL